MSISRQATDNYKYSNTKSRVFFTFFFDMKWIIEIKFTYTFDMYNYDIKCNVECFIW